MQANAESLFDTAISRKVSTGVFRPTVPNRSQKEDVLTSSNQLKSGFRKGLAFPITLVAVGLLLASLVLGFGTNLAHALGDGSPEGGICGYSDLMRGAILANNGDEAYDCNGATYTGAVSSWGGTTTTAAGAELAGVLVANEQDEANDLDLSDKGLDVFKPGKGELDGFVRGSRVDLTGNGLTVADIDLSDAVGTLSDTAYSKFGAAIGSGDGTLVPGGVRKNTMPNGLGVTFLLDGGSTTANGLTIDPFEGVEGEIVWITFEYGDWPDAFTDLNTNDGGVWMRVNFTVDGVAAETVSALINSQDADGTLYAVPYRTIDDADNDFGRTDKRSIEATLAGVGTFAEAVAGPIPEATATVDYAEEYDDSIPRASKEADLLVVDEDDPPVSVADRQDAVADPIADQVGLSAKRVGIDQLAGNDIGDDGALLTTLKIGGGGDVDKIDSISAADLSGLTGLTGSDLAADSPIVALDLSNNELIDLPSGLFADVGSADKGDLTTLIDLIGNKGPTDDGFMLDNLGDVGSELIAGQVLRVNWPRKDNRVGFLQNSYEAIEGDAWVFDVNIDEDDLDEDVTPVIQLRPVAGDSGTVADDVNKAFIDLGSLTRGNYRIAIGLPENEDEDGDNTLTAIFGHGTVDADAGTGAVTTILGIASLTIRDASYSAPVVVVPAETGFGSIVVTQNEYVEAPGNEDLKHNVSNLLVAVGDDSVAANFLDIYSATGGLDRWGYPTSEVVIIEDGALSQFYQRGVLDFHNTGSGYIVERRLAWDYVGGGAGGSVDQGVEVAPDSGPEGGVQVGAFGHYVANVDADGNATGFLDAFNSFGGVDGLGIPKTEARADTGDAGTLLEPGGTIGFTRQYFQAAVLQLSEAGTVELTLLGDTLRDLLVPGFADEAAFGAADAASIGDELSPDVIS